LFLFYLIFHSLILCNGKGPFRGRLITAFCVLFKHQTHFALRITNSNADR
jgi:hypothetical protein